MVCLLRAKQCVLEGRGGVSAANSNGIWHLLCRPGSFKCARTMLSQPRVWRSCDRDLVNFFHPMYYTLATLRFQFFLPRAYRRCALHGFFGNSYTKSRHFFGKSS